MKFTLKYWPPSLPWNSHSSSYNPVFRSHPKWLKLALVYSLLFPLSNYQQKWFLNVVLLKHNPCLQWLPPLPGKAILLRPLWSFNQEKRGLNLSQNEVPKLIKLKVFLNSLGLLFQPPGRRWDFFFSSSAKTRIFSSPQGRVRREIDFILYFALHWFCLPRGETLLELNKRHHFYEVPVTLRLCWAMETSASVESSDSECSVRLAQCRPAQ